MAEMKIGIYFSFIKSIWIDGQKKNVFYMAVNDFWNDKIRNI